MDMNDNMSKQAVRQVEITVTADDILFGEPNDFCGCPIALAAKRLGFHHIAVSGSWLAFDMADGARYSGLLPETAREFVSNFDVGGPVDPFAFAVEISPA